MFTTLIVQPIFNLLVLIYALIPGHNFGLAIILFTIVVRLCLWPLVKRQLHQTKMMRRIQPELRRIAKETKGDRQRQALLQMELYKEKGINPFRSFGVVLLQFPILIGLYIGLQKVIKDPHQIVDFAYPALQNLSWMKELGANIDKFDTSLFGLVDLHRAAVGPLGLYIPALLIVIASVVVQYLQARQLMPQDKESRGLRAILKDAGKGEQADQQEVNAAVSRMTIFFLPALIFVFTVSLASALSLYWFVGGLVAYIQQSIVLREDQTEMAELSQPAGAASKSSGKHVSQPSKISINNIPEAEVVDTAANDAKNTNNSTNGQKSSKKKGSKPKKRRK